MTKDEIMQLDAEQIEQRSVELGAEIEAAENNEVMDAIQEELEAIEERKAEIKAEVEQRKLDLAAVIKGQGEVVEEIKEERNNNTMEIRNTPEYINAYAEFIKTGDDRECRTLLTENVSGSVPVPELVYDIVKTGWDTEGIMAYVRKEFMRGNLKVPFEVSAQDAVVHTEGGDAVTEEQLVEGIVNLVPVSLKKLVKISDEAYDMTGENFIRYIYDEIGHKIYKKAADTVIAKIQACGTVSTTTCPGVPKFQAATAALGDIAQAMAKLSDDAANPVVMMNKATWGTYKALQAAGNYGYDPFEGLPVLYNNTIKAYSAATTGETYAIVGDLGEGVIANYPRGEEITFKFDEMTSKAADLIEILGRQYVGIGVVAPNAFCKIVK